MSFSDAGRIQFAIVLVALAIARPAGQVSVREVPDVRTLLAEGLYEQAERVAWNDVDQLRALDGDASLQFASAADVLARALIVNGRATDDKTIALARKTLRVKETILGPDHPELVTSLLNLGDVLAAAADFEEATAVASRALVLREKNADAAGLEIADVLDHLGNTLSAAKRYPEALNALDRSLRIKEGALEGTDIAIARTLESIALTRQRQGTYEHSAAPIRRAAAIQEAATIDHPAYAETLNLVAQQLWFEGRLNDSRVASERALALAERTLRPDHPTVAMALLLLGSTLADLGELGPSLALKQRALAMAERNFGANHHQTALYLHSVAYARLREGSYVIARDHFRRALSIFEARYGPWHQEVATTLSMLARADASLGNYSSARREQTRAVAIHERVGGPTHPFVAVALTDLAMVHREEGLPAQALALLGRALAIREKNLGPDHRDVARTLTDIASTLLQTGQVTRAQAAATRAVAIWERLHTPDAPEYATALALYGDLQARRGDDIAARDYYQRAMAIRAKVFGTSNPDYADTQAGLALTLANLGNRESALDNAASAEAIGRAHLRMMLQSLPERESLNYAAVRPRGLDLILSLSGSTPEAAAFAGDSLIRSRALVLDEMAARRGSARTQIESTDPLRTAFASAQQRLANLVVRGPEKVSPAQYTALVENARRESELAEQALAERSAEFRQERNRAQLGLDEVRASIPSDSALVSFVRYDRAIFSASENPPAAARAHPQSVPSYVAFVLRAEMPPAVVPLGSAQSIDRRVTQWRADIRAEALTTPEPSPAESNRSSRASGSSLRRLVWDPLAPHLGNAKRVFIVPDGALSLVPFVALPVGQRSYLLDRGPVLHYLSAERDLVATGADAVDVSRGLLALGGPSFDDPTLFGAGANRTRAMNALPVHPDASVRGSGCESVRDMTFPPLTGTLQEVRELSRMWSTSTMSHDEGSRVLVGRDASESTFKKEAHGYRVLHLATHGFFLGNACSPALPGTRAVGGITKASGSRPAAKPAENPLLLSGLALAGANRRLAAGPDEDDGILTAEEVAALDLAGVEWAVLSACDTGVGQIKTGEGVFGLRRAFQVAGARAVIMSLWSVDDQATRAWMRALYEGRFQKSLSTADAVHAATVAVLRDRRAKSQATHPFYWGGFIAAGDWR